MDCLTELANAATDLVRRGMQGVIHEGCRMQDKVRVPEIPVIHVLEQGQSVHIEFDPPPPGQDITIGSTVVNMDYPQVDLKKFVHDFTFYVFGPDFDRRFDAVFPIIGDGNDNLTPDLILELDECYLVAEFTTTQSSNINSYRVASDAKRVKYFGALTVRLGRKPIVYFILVCGPSGLYTNALLHQDVIDEICHRFKVGGEVIYDIGSKLGLKTSDMDIRSTENQSKAREILQSIKFTWDKTAERFPAMTEEVYNSWKTSDIDLPYVKSCIAKSMDLAREELTAKHFTINDVITLDQRHRLNESECRHAIESFELKHKDSDLYQPSHSTKSICNIPFWVVDHGHPTPDLIDDLGRSVFEPIGVSHDPTFQAIFSAIKSVESEPSLFPQEDEEILMNIALGPDQRNANQPHKMPYHRVSIILEDNDKSELMKIGVFKPEDYCKKEVQEYRNRTKKSLAVDCFTDDVDRAVGASIEALWRPSRVRSEEKKDVMGMIKSGYSLHGPSIGKEWIAHAESWIASSLGSWSGLVTAIATELSISLRQHCKHGVMILKKLRNHKAFLLIRPTNSTGHLFFTLFAYNKDIVGQPFGDSSVFKETRTNGIISWTEFSSVNSSKLENLVRCESMMYAMTSYWMEFYRVPFWDTFKKKRSSYDIEKKMNNPVGHDASRMIFISLMIFTNDKAKVEEVITMSRFVFMEGFVSFPLLPKPHKMIEKIPGVFRSRLQVWVTKKLLSAMTRIVSTGGFGLYATGSEMVWKDMFNMFTGRHLESPFQLTSLFYLGYLKNKNEAAEKNGTAELYKKIIEMENLKPKTRDYLGLKDPPVDNVQKHEFSPSMVKFLCRNAIVTLKKIHGESVLDRLELSILDNLGSYTIEKLCTLKASSAFDESSYKYDPSKKYGRKRAAEAVRPLLISDKCTKAIDLLVTALNKVEEQGGMHIDIFKKSQHGGLREIYVLGISERIVQLGLENIARAVCKLFPYETLTNPKYKVTKNGLHDKEAKVLFGSAYSTLAKAADAWRWNQCHFTTKFALTLMEFTPDYMHPFIIRGISLFLNKKMMLDPNLMAIVVGNSKINTTNNFLQTFHDCYWGMTDEHPSWMPKELGQYVITETGMCQGILHYSSSLVHCIKMEFTKNFAHEFMSLHSRKKGADPRKVLVSTAVSSDDSELKISIEIKSEEDLRRASIYIALCFLFDKHFGPFIGIYESVKTTTNMAMVGEFNSEYTFYKNTIKPLLRWIAAVNLISEQESLASRQGDMASNLTNVLSGGGSFSLTAHCQIAQALLHYTLLGSGVCAVFGKLCEEMKKVPDPSNGFFYMDFPFFAGLCGFIYNLWNAVKHSDLGKCYKSMIAEFDTRLNWKDKRLTLEITHGGSFVHTRILKWGNRKRHQRLIENLKFSPTWKEEIDLDPEVLYRWADNLQEVLLKLAKIMHSPGVSSSLCTGVNITRVVASSVYLATSHVLTES